MFRGGKKVALSLTSAVIPARLLTDLAWRRYGFRVGPLDPARAAKWRIRAGSGWR